MPRNQTRYIVTRPEETRGLGNGAGSYIPSIGAATTVTDQYRTVGISSTNVQELNTAITDTESVVALSKIAEGGIQHYEDIEAAETALQALLLHDHVNVVTVAPKIERITSSPQNFISYQRLDNNKRTPFGFELLQLAQSMDWLIAPEYIQEENGIIIESTLQNSNLINRPISILQNNDFNYMTPNVSEAVNATLCDHKMPLYLSNKALINTHRPDGFAQHFYHRMRASWRDHVDIVNTINCSIELPPFLAIILDRLQNREDLKTIVAELRDETAQSRKELKELDKMIQSPRWTQAEQEAKVRRINESFDAIVPESRLSPATRRRRTVGRISNIIRPIARFLPAFITGTTSLSLDEALNTAGGLESAIFESTSITDRTNTARTYEAQLRDMQGTQSLLNQHLSPAEINAIERSLRT